MGLDSGGSCQGMAMLAPGSKRDEIIDYLRARELVTDVYLECWRNVNLSSGEKVPALVYRADRSHQQYASGLCLDTQTEIMRNSHGKSGHNVDYVKSTVSAMKEHGIRDHSLEYIDAKLQS